MRSFPLLVAGFLIGLGCSSKKTPDPKPTAPEKAASRPADPTGPVATVNGKPVSRERLERELAQSRARYELTRKEVQPAMMANLRRTLVRRLVEAEVLRQKADELGLAPSPEEQEMLWREYRKRLGTEEAFQSFLERSGTTEADLRARFEDNLIRERVNRHVTSTIAFSDEELQTYYEEHIDRFRHPDAVHLRQIVVEVPKASPPDYREVQRDKARKTLERLRNGADFAVVAGAVSDGPGRDRGGDLGFAERSRLLPEVAAVAFRLKPGQLSDVIETKFGFTIIQVLEVRPAHTESFAQARPAIERRLVAQRRRKKVHEALETWKSEMDIELFEDTQLFTPGYIKPSKHPEGIIVPDGFRRRVGEPEPIQERTVQPPADESGERER